MIILRQHTSNSFMRPEITAQRICLGVGAMFIFLVFVGLIKPDAFGLNLSEANTLIYFITGAFAVWSVVQMDLQKVVTFSLSMGSAFAILGSVSFLMSDPGYSNVIPQMGADQHMFKAIPYLLEFTTGNHILHMVVGMLLITAGILARHNIKRVSSRVIGIVNYKYNILK